MSENLDHQGMEILSAEECWELVAGQPVGRIAFLEAGDPMVLPVNHTVVGRRVVFRTLKGTLLHEGLMDKPVAFEVDDWDAPAREGWSVIIRGVASIPDDDSEFDDLELDAWADKTDRDDWVTVLAEEISGRRIVH